MKKIKVPASLQIIVLQYYIFVNTIISFVPIWDVNNLYIIDELLNNNLIGSIKLFAITEYFI